MLIFDANASGYADYFNLGKSTILSLFDKLANKNITEVLEMNLLNETCINMILSSSYHLRLPTWKSIVAS